MGLAVEDRDGKGDKVEHISIADIDKSLIGDENNLVTLEDASKLDIHRVKHNLYPDVHDFSF